MKRQIQLIGCAALISFVTTDARAADTPADAYYTLFGSGNVELMGNGVASIGDFDNDGVPDFAIGSPAYANFGGLVRLYSGSSGSNINEIAGTSSISGFGWSIASMGDVNGDGVSDIAISAPLELIGQDPYGAVYIYSGATFGIIRHYVGPNIATIFGWSIAAIGDLDGDHITDLLVGEPYFDTFSGTNCGRVCVYSGASFTQITQFAGSVADGDFGWSVANLGDVNGDGYDDALVGAPGIAKAYIIDLHNSAVIRWFGNSPIDSEFGYSVASAGDSNNDGIQDVLIGARSFKVGGLLAGRAYVYNGATGGLRFVMSGVDKDRFGTAVAEVGDVNGDGTDDLAIGGVQDGGGGKLEIHSGNNGALLRIITGGNGSVSFGSTIAKLGDLNNDGINDFLVADVDYAGNGNSGAAYVFTGEQNQFGLTAPANYAVVGNVPTMILSADLDGDGKTDVASVGNNYISLYHGTGHGGFDTPHAYATGASPMCVTACDANRDGLDDLIVGTAGNNRVTFYRSTTSSVVYNGYISLGLKPSSIAVADFNHDGRDDLAISWRDSNKVTVLFANNANGYLSTRFTLHATIGVGLAPIQVVTGRINADIYPDMLVVNRDSKTLSVYINKGNGSFYKKPDVQLDGTPLYLALADLNQDGLGDLALITAASSNVLVRPGNGLGAFDAGELFTTGAGPRSVAIKDVDHDGLLDLVTSNWGNDAVSLLVNNGAGGFNAPLNISTGFDPTCSVITDVDRDGDQDILTINRGSKTISVTLNQWVN